VNLLLPVLSLLGIESKALVEHWKRKAIAYGAVAGLLVVGLVFLLVAAFIALSGWVGPLWAALLMAGLFLLVALSVYLGERIAARAEARRQEERRRAGETRALFATTAVSALPVLLKSPLLRRWGLPAGAALAAFYVLSRAGAPREGGGD
jgi:protein-S-isoprenylcysteine O-methyltransferase Ste14